MKSSLNLVLFAVCSKQKLKEISRKEYFSDIDQDLGLAVTKLSIGSFLFFIFNLVFVWTFFDLDKIQFLGYSALSILQLWAMIEIPVIGAKRFLNYAQPLSRCKESCSAVLDWVSKDEDIKEIRDTVLQKGRQLIKTDYFDMLAVYNKKLLMKYEKELPTELRTDLIKKYDEKIKKALISSVLAVGLAYAYVFTYFLMPHSGVGTKAAPVVILILLSLFAISLYQWLGLEKIQPLTKDLSLYEKYLVLKEEALGREYLKIATPDLRYVESLRAFLTGYEQFLTKRACQKAHGLD